MTSRIMVSVLALVLTSSSHLAAVPTSTAFTYQGQLKDAGAPADGAYDMRFSIFNVATAGSAVAGPLVFDGTGGNPPEAIVVNGLFSVVLDFGPIYDGTALWLHIEVRPHGAGGYTALTPRQPLTATPFAIFALDGPGQAGFWQANGSSIHKTNSGNVGIGATDPQANLEVRATGFPKLRVAKVHTGGIGAFAPAVLELKSNFTGTDQPYGRVNFLDGNDAVRGSIEYGNAPSLAPVSLRLGTAGQTRMAITDAGNVGIGTAAPIHPLDVVGRARIQQAVGGNTAGMWFNQRGPNEDRAFVGMRNDLEVGLYGTEGAGWGFVMDVGTGNVGIDQASPATKLHINGGSDTSLGGGGFLVMGSTSGQNMSIDNNEVMSRNNGATAPLFLNNDGGNIHMAVVSGGVSIGTNYIPPGVLLAVDGKIMCEEMEVQLSGDWPDFVFEEGYPLMPLAELEQSLAANKHLPGIPSAAQVTKEGINVGEMQGKLLQKVEELTLYMIETNKQVEFVRVENAQLHARIAELEAAR